MRNRCGRKHQQASCLTNLASASIWNIIEINRIWKRDYEFPFKLRSVHHTFKKFYSAFSYQNISCLSCLSLVGDFPKASVIGGGLGFLAIVFIVLIAALVYKKLRHNSTRCIPKTSRNCAQHATRVLVARTDGIQKHRQFSNNDVELETYPAIEAISETRFLEREQSNTGLKTDKPLSNEHDTFVLPLELSSHPAHFVSQPQNYVPIQPQNPVTCKCNDQSASNFESGNRGRAPISKISPMQNVHMASDDDEENDHS